MPPGPLSRKILRKLERSPYEEQLFHSDILASQSTDSTGYLADTMLICDGGSLPAHGFLLQAVSPVFQSAILSQGENYPFIREILLPDFSVKEIERMLTFIYKGYVNLESELDMKNLQDSLNFFQISNATQGGIDKRKIVGTLKIDQFNRIPQDIFQDEVETLNSFDDDGDDDGHIIIPFSTSPVEEPRKGKKRKAGEKSPKKVNSDDDDSDYNPDSDDEKIEGNTPKKNSNMGPPRPGKLLQPVLKLKRWEPESSKPSGIIKSKQSMSSSPTTSNSLDETKKEEGVETDEEDKGWEEPPYDDKDWITKEASKCQLCSKDYGHHKAALQCVTLKHKAVRCYFCFKIYSDTEILFRHFAKRHKSAPGKEKTSMCHFCDQMIAWKSVSSHVISVHLKKCFDNPQDDNDNKKSMPIINPPALTAIQVVDLTSPVVNSPIDNNPPNEDEAQVKNDGSNSKNGTEKDVKKLKVLKVGDLDVTVERQTRFGSILTFHIKRIRDNGTESTL